MTRFFKAAALEHRLARAFELGGEASSTRNFPMEGLRGLAVTLVFFVHYNALFREWVPPHSASHAASAFLASIGLSGVDLFFVLSGYLIYGAIIARQPRYFPFIRRRIQRIYPTFLCVFVLYLVLSYVFPVKRHIPETMGAATLYIIQNALLLPGMLPIPAMISVAWSLSYEFFFYLTLPAFVLLLGLHRWTPLHRVILWTVVSVLFIAYAFLTRLVQAELMMFLAGMLLFEAIRFFDWRLRADYAVLAGMVVMFGAIYVLLDRPELLPAWTGAVSHGVQYRLWILFAGFFLFTGACFTSTGILRNMFSWTPLRWLGNMSYSYYLLHGLTLHGLHLVASTVVTPGQHVPAPLFWVTLVLCFAGTIVTSSILFLVVEKPLSLTRSSPRLQRRPVLQRVPAASE